MLHNIFVNRKRLFGLVSAVMIISIFLGGCEPLRKKFKRKKKEAKQDETVLVLEPIEYPAPVYSAVDTYKHHYSLWGLWHKELLNIIIDKDNARRKVFLIDKAISELEGMRLLILEANRSDLDKIIAEMESVREDLMGALPKRTVNTLRLKLTQLEGRIRRECKFEVVQDYLLNEEPVGQEE